MEATIRIEGMSCGHCVGAVERALKEIPGVREVRVEVGKAVIVSDAPVPAHNVESAIEDAGFRVVV